MHNLLAFVFRSVGKTLGFGAWGFSKGRGTKKTCFVHLLMYSLRDVQFPHRAERCACTRMQHMRFFFEIGKWDITAPHIMGCKDDEIGQIIVLTETTNSWAG